MAWRLVLGAVGSEAAKAGHEVITMDLPCDDGSATFDDYADVVCAAINGATDVVLVGHSQGGHTVPLVAARRPIRHLVYVCALVPDIGRSLVDQINDKPVMLNPAYQAGLSEPDERMRHAWIDLDVATAMFYLDCDDATIGAALKRLRPQALLPATVPFSLGDFPAVPTTYVVCDDDQIVNPEWSRLIARDRLGADVVELPGSHSPMLSRPESLAEVLLQLG